MKKKFLLSICLIVFILNLVFLRGEVFAQEYKYDKQFREQIFTTTSTDGSLIGGFYEHSYPYYDQVKQEWQYQEVEKEMHSDFLNGRHLSFFWADAMANLSYYASSTDYKDLANNVDPTLLKYAYRIELDGLQVFGAKIRDADDSAELMELGWSATQLATAFGTGDKAVEGLIDGRQALLAAICYKGSGAEWGETTHDFGNINIKDDYATKNKYSKAQIERYLKIFGQRYGVSSADEAKLKKEWAKILNNGVEPKTEDEMNQILEKARKIGAEGITKQLTLLSDQELGKEIDEHTASSRMNYEHPKRADTQNQTQIDIDEAITDADEFKNSATESKITGEQINDIMNPMYNIALICGVVIAVIIGLVLGIKFITGSVSQQADVKKLIIPYIAGCIIVFGAFGIWKVAVIFLDSM